MRLFCYKVRMYPTMFRLQLSMEVLGRDMGMNDRSLLSCVRRAHRYTMLVLNRDHEESARYVKL